ncbi:molybdenum cofactor guanylyltransferase [Saccharibacillus endophyticus]|uniref:Probable molybdenum cofactor guanylyltransferase n=1 Tax=Saccharibacillus endophyticus TaxID=2060666 RepID=A0ABQ1ZN15_9BACL|nr:molybdenum cofactor guanylyltransferase [Saccharibacillus endophyticus]GGH69850.1 putative molybdenum cofactor guanylyltransferase [Saccharibacillus endophyticus]
MNGADGTHASGSDREKCRTVGVLLAGGLSRRFGSPKAFARLSGEGADGRMFYERALDALREACDTVLVVASRELENRFPPHLDVCTDLPQMEGRGPLAGICTAMRKHPNARYVVMACDMPFIGAADVRKLLETAGNVPAADVVAVRTAEAPVPLFSVWRHGAADRLEESVSAGDLSVMKRLAGLNTCWIDAVTINENENVFRNCNTPDDSDIKLN